MTQLSVSEARAILPEVLDRVGRGEEITITRHGRPPRSCCDRMLCGRHLIINARVVDVGGDDPLAAVAAIWPAGNRSCASRPAPIPAIAGDLQSVPGLGGTPGCHLPVTDQ